LNRDFYAAGGAGLCQAIFVIGGVVKSAIIVEAAQSPPTYVEEANAWYLSIHSQTRQNLLSQS